MLDIIEGTNGWSMRFQAAQNLLRPAPFTDDDIDAGYCLDAPDSMPNQVLWSKHLEKPMIYSSLPRDF